MRYLITQRPRFKNMSSNVSAQPRNEASDWCKQMVKLISCLLAVVLGTFSLLENVSAQAVADRFDPNNLPVLRADPDFNGIDPASGTYPTASPFTLSVPASGNLTSRTSYNGRRTSSTLNVYLDDETYSSWPSDGSERHIRLQVGGQDKLFTCYNVPLAANEPNGTVTCSQVAEIDGSQLAYDNATDSYRLTDKQGTVYQFFPLARWPRFPLCDGASGDDGCNDAKYVAYAFASQILYPTGEKLTYEPFPVYVATAEPRHVTYTVRSNLGYRIEFRRFLAANQTQNPITVPGTGWLEFRNWIPREKSLYRGTELLQGLTTTTSTPPVNGEFEVVETDALSREYRLKLKDSGAVGCVFGDEGRGFATVPIEERSPAGVTTLLQYHRVDASDSLSPGFLRMMNGSSPPVATVTRGGVTWNYAGYGPFGAGGPQSREMTHLGVTRSVKYVHQVPYGGANDYIGCQHGVVGHLIYEYKDELQRRTEYSYEWTKGLLDWTRLPERNGYDYTYDARGNITEISRLQKGTGNTPILQLVFRAEYPQSCENPKTCNQPTKVWDAEGITKGYYTEYTYYPTHGGVDTVTLPALDGVRPQARHYYTSYDTGDGIIFRETSASTCIRGSACEGTDDEVKVVTTYWGGTFLPESKTVSSGSGSVSAIVSFQYDNAGRVTVATDELNQQTHSFYDAASRRVGEIGPDPDGAGPLPRLATRTTYNDDDQVTRVENGTATGTSLAALNSMIVRSQADTGYDQLGRKVIETKSAAGIPYGITQYSYDDWDRPVCTAVRMNLTVHPDACTATQGPEGYDRVTRNYYDAAGQLKSVKRGLGTPLEQTYTEYDYTQNGKQWLIADANANTTELDYDDADRLTAMYFPVKFTGSRVASTADYEVYGYDLNDNRTSFRRRDGVTLTYDYNSLNLVKAKYVPARAGLSATHTESINYHYDLRGKLEKALFASSGEGIEQETDALDHLKFSKSTLDAVSRTLTYGFNAKLRTGVTHPDSQAFTYGYDNAHRLTTVTHPVAGTLAGFTYDAAGDPDVLSGGVTTSFDFDGVGRLTSLAHDLAGTGQDNTYGYQYNPASQLKGITATNGSFAPAVSTRNETYQVNGLNQYTHVSGVEHVYDAKGNLTSDGQSTYVYDQENRLVRATTNTGALKAELWYDPLGRLYKLQSPTATTHFLYDGDELVAEYDATSNTLTQRYVHGAAVDDPVAWFQGAAVTAGTRRHLRANHQGSIVAAVDAAGNALHVLRYDTWGNPVGTHPLRFGYTGQAWIPELGLWHYKARMYSPKLGRFLQTDPVGYADQMNLYAYVGNDPFNKNDPTGEIFETLWDAFNVGMGVASFASNIVDGNFGAAAVDAVGVAMDVAATLAPGVPGGAGTVIKANRAADMAKTLARAGDKASNVVAGAKGTEKAAAAAKGVVEKTASGKRVGDYTRSQKAAAKAENAKVNGGQMKCNDCAKPVKNVASEKGVSTPPNQAQVHHDPPIVEGGGRHSKPVVLCPECHGLRHLH